MSNKVDRGTYPPGTALTIPVGKKLWFYTGGDIGYYLMCDGTNFSVCDHDDHPLFNLHYSSVPTIQDGTLIATATPPQEYDLPLMESVVSELYPCKYSKNSFGMVVVNIGISIAEAAEGAVIATLPVGFRPPYRVANAGVVLTENGRIAVSFDILENGGICLFGEAGKLTSGILVGLLVFYAE